MIHYLLNKLTTSSAGNFGSLLAGVCSLITLILWIVCKIFNSLRLWLKPKEEEKQKEKEKMSEIADKVRQNLPKNEHLRWLISPSNINSAGNGYNLVNKIKELKDLVKDLLDKQLNKLFNDLEKNAQSAAYNNAVFLHDAFDGLSKATAYTEFRKAEKVIEEIYNDIQKKLLSYIMFKK